MKKFIITILIFIVIPLLMLVGNICGQIHLGVFMLLTLMI